jgi:hypothetical protein
MNERIKEHGAHFSKSSYGSFGPQISKLKIPSIKNIRRLVHYDCNNDEEDYDIPNEDEVYIKENLLERRLGDEGSE